MQAIATQISNAPQADGVTFANECPSLGRLATVLALSHHIKGWLRSGFNSRSTKIEVSRATIDGVDQAHISISIDEWKGNADRCYSHHGSMTLLPNEIDLLIAALQGARNNKEG